MKTVLVLGSQQPTARLAIAKLHRTPDVQVVEVDENKVDVTHASAYLPALKDVDIVLSFLGPLDVDLAFEGLFDAVAEAHPKLSDFVILSTAGIDNEVAGQLEYPDVPNVKEYLNQQRYAIKVVDEAEIPYTVLRPVKLVNQDSAALTVYNEGQPMPSGTVSRETIAEVAVAAALNHQYINQSIGLVQTITGGTNHGNES